MLVAFASKCNLSFGTSRYEELSQNFVRVDWPGTRSGIFEGAVWNKLATEFFIHHAGDRTYAILMQLITTSVILLGKSDQEEEFESLEISTSRLALGQGASCHDRTLSLMLTWTRLVMLHIVQFSTAWKSPARLNADPKILMRRCFNGRSFALCEVRTFS